MMFLKKWKYLLIGVLMLALAGFSLVGYLRCGNVLQSQQAAQTWAGEHETEFVQISCFLPAKEPLSRNDIYDFRNRLSAELAQISLEDSLVCDAWSSETNVTVSVGTKEFQTFATAVGGSFFQFHPMELLSGCYIWEEDLMHDRVVLDRELAWKLFGGTDLAGMTMLVNGQPFQITGVVERERDKGSEIALSEETGLYLFFDVLPEVEKQGISCYEIILPEPVENFGINFVENSLSIKNGVVIQNTDRYSIPSTFSRLLNFGTWSMQHAAVEYPYWENAARYYQDWCMLFAVFTVLFCAVSVIMIAQKCRAVVAIRREK